MKHNYIRSSILFMLFYLPILAQDPNWTTSWHFEGGRTYVTDSHMDIQNNILTVGTNSGVAANYNCILNKFSSQGALQFTKYFSTGSGGTAPSVTTDKNNNIYVFGDLYVYVLNSSGDSLVQFMHNCINNRKIEIDSAGNIFLYSVSYDNDTNNFGPKIIKFNPQGIELWDFVPFPITTPAGETAILNDAIVDESGNSTITGSIFRNGVHSVFTAKIDMNGLLIWKDEFTISGKNIISGNKIAVGASGITYVAGHCGVEFHTNTYDALTLAYASDGNLLWSKTFDNTVDQDQAVDIKSFGSGVVVSGLSKYKETTPMFTVYYSATGSESWRFIDTGTKWIDAFSFGNFPPASSTIVIDGDEIFISGSIRTSNVSTNFTTYKINNQGIVKGKAVFPAEFIGRHQNSLMVNDDIILICSDTDITNAFDYTKIISYAKNKITDISSESLIQKSFTLFQNYPNPSNPSTIISYQLEESTIVSLKIYDLLGKLVAELVNEYKEQGNYKITFNPNDFNLGSGVYFYRLSTGEKYITKKMILLK